MWMPPAPAPPPPAWWHEWTYQQHVSRGRAYRKVREQDRRRAEIRRTVQRTREVLCLAESAGGVRRAGLRPPGDPNEWRSAGVELEHFVGRQVGPLEMYQAYRDEAGYSRSNRRR